MYLFARIISTHLLSGRYAFVLAIVCLYLLV